MTLACHGLLLSCWLHADAAGSTVVADACNVDVVVHHCRVVHVVDHAGVDVCHALVVVELAAPPITAVIAAARVAVAIIDAAIEADLWSPIPVMPVVRIVDKCPVARSPKQSDFRRKYPRAGHPVVAVDFVISPITGNPDIAWPRADRLCIDW